MQQMPDARPWQQEFILDDARWILAFVKSRELGCTIALRNLGPVVQLAAQGRQVCHEPWSQHGQKQICPLQGHI